jgi:rhomboid protease GluP
LGNLYDYAGGASGAIFGLMGIMIVVAFFNKGHVSGISLWNLVVLSILTILNGYVSEGIDNVAHVSGLVFGIIVGIFIILLKQKVVKNTQI